MKKAAYYGAGGSSRWRHRSRGVAEYEPSARAGKTYTSSTGVMAQRSAKQAVAYMSQYFASQGWIPQTMVQTADRNASSTPGLPAF
jgi:hypothetical protein